MTIFLCLLFVQLLGTPRTSNAGFWGFQLDHLRFVPIVPVSIEISKARSLNYLYIKLPLKLICFVVRRNLVWIRNCPHNLLWTKEYRMLPDIITIIAVLPLGGHKNELWILGFYIVCTHDVKLKYCSTTCSHTNRNNPFKDCCNWITSMSIISF